MILLRPVLWTRSASLRSYPHTTQHSRLIHLYYASTTKFALGNHRIKEFNQFNYPDPKDYRLEIWKRKPLKREKIATLDDVQKKILEPGTLLVPLDEEDEKKLPPSEIPRYHLKKLNLDKVYQPKKMKTKGRGSKEFHFLPTAEGGHFANCMYKAYHFLSRKLQRSPLELHIHFPGATTMKYKKKKLSEPIKKPAEIDLEKLTAPVIKTLHLWPSTILKAMPEGSMITVGPLYSKTRICCIIDIANTTMQNRFEHNKKIQLDLDRKGQGTSDKETRRRIKQDLKKIREDLKSENKNCDIPMRELTKSIPGFGLKRPETFESKFSRERIPVSYDEKLNQRIEKIRQHLDLLEKKQIEVKIKAEREEREVLERVKTMYSDDEFSESKRAELVKQCTEQWAKKERLIISQITKKTSTLKKFCYQAAQRGSEWAATHGERPFLKGANLDDENPFPLAQDPELRGDPFRPLVRAVGCGDDKVKLFSKLASRDDPELRASRDNPELRGKPLRPLVRAVGCGDDKVELFSKLASRDNPELRGKPLRPLVRAVGCGDDKVELFSKLASRDNPELRGKPLRPLVRAVGCGDDKVELFSKLASRDNLIRKL
ncbi:hypothetical protein K3495_g10248 [Podosphaera aphanis]|nr:hypothetical protein K3495_g10248 [Podosphaera aphanis]